METRIAFVVVWALVFGLLANTVSATTGRLAPLGSLSPRSTPLVTLGDAPFVCRARSQCTPCPAEQMNTPVCRVWGNRRSLECTPSSIVDPDQQHHPHASHQTLGNDTSAAVSPNNEHAPSKFYHYEPTEPTVSSDEDSDPVVVSTNDPLIELELEQALNADKRRSLDLDHQTDQGLYWEACPRVIKQEQSDYFEFVLCNLFFALAGLSVLLYRQRTLAGRQFGKLAARIMQTVEH
ncbi:uncharacterized protein JCM15063_001879 [Sporobolomyces koalae]|uniref:uncharacterized protein n=1 Tax=Sporobolomyces koalae TaxID=500713 RepID=UPI00317BABEF